MTVNLSKKINAVLPAETMRLLDTIGKKANELGYAAFLVGGVVRDLIRGVKNLDLDVVVEGDAIRLGEGLSKELDAAIVIHKRFGTCTLVIKKGLKIDFATARREIYERPAALPTVEFGPLKYDLARRDFTINAMAVSLNKKNFGKLIDLFGGKQDLARGAIKVLHRRSFIDDPTRIFRAARFESRPGFAIEAKTLRLAKEAVRKGMLARLSIYRTRKEMVLILKEEGRHKALERLKKLGAGIIQPFEL